MKRKVKRVIFFGGRRDTDEGDSESGILGGIGGIVGKEIFGGGFPTTITPFTYIAPGMLRACAIKSFVVVWDTDDCLSLERSFSSMLNVNSPEIQKRN